MELKKSYIVYYGPWQVAIACKHALCTDGKQRYVHITGQPDTYFSIPGCVRVKGKTVTGFVTYDDELEVHTFHANVDGKNYHLLPRKEEKA